MEISRLPDQRGQNRKEPRPRARAADGVTYTPETTRQGGVTSVFPATSPLLEGIGGR